MESFCLRLFLIDFKKLTWRALGWFTCGNLKEVLSKLIGNWSGELLVHLHMESLRNPFQNQLDFFWRAPDHFIYGILKETIAKLSQSWSGTLLVNLHMESLRTSFQNRYGIGLESYWSI